jgi:hypothetical protein
MSKSRALVLRLRNVLALIVHDQTTPTVTTIVCDQLGHTAWGAVAVNAITLLRIVLPKPQGHSKAS